MEHLATGRGDVGIHVHHPRHPELSLIVLILLVAAALRIADLTRLPPGFSSDEITNIQLAQTVRTGQIATFYPVNSTTGGYEGLYPILQAINTSVMGNGLLSYRIVSLWSGLFSIALMYVLARRLFGSFAGIGAAVALTITLWPLLLSRSAIREALLLPLYLGMLLTMTRALHLSRNIGPESPVTFTFTMLGVLFAGVIYTHWTGLIGGPLFLVFLAYLIITRQPISRRVVSLSAFAFLVATILGIPYFTFTLRRLSWSGFYTVWANRPEDIGMFITNALKTLASLIFVGDPLAQHNLPNLPLIGPLGAILLIVGLIFAARRWRWPNMTLALVTLVIGLLPGMWARGEPNFANLVVVLPALMALIGLGAAVLAQQFLNIQAGYTQALQSAGGAINARAFLVIVLVMALGVQSNQQLFFRQWAADSRVEAAYTGRLGHLAAYLDRTRDGLTTSICTLNLRNHDRITDPDLLDLMMHHPDNSIRFSDCLTGLVLTRGGAHQRFAYADIAARDALPPVFNEWFRYAIPVDVAGLSRGTVFGFDMEKELADVSGKLMFGYVEWSPETQGASPVAALPVRMGGYLTFQGYRLASGTVYKPGDTVTLVTYWRVDGPQESDLRIFAHILNHPNTEPIVQNDVLSVDASLLRNRDVFVQIITVPLPDPFPAGDYRISVGAYHSSTQIRLPVYDANRERGDRLFLSTITVKD